MLFRFIKYLYFLFYCYYYYYINSPPKNNFNWNFFSNWKCPYRRKNEKEERKKKNIDEAYWSIILFLSSFIFQKNIYLYNIQYKKKQNEWLQISYIQEINLMKSILYIDIYKKKTNENREKKCKFSSKEAELILLQLQYIYIIVITNDKDDSTHSFFWNHRLSLYYPSS